MFAPRASAPASRLLWRAATAIRPARCEHPARMRERVVMIDAGFEAVLATVLLFGVVFGSIDERDYPAPASDIVLAVFAFALFAFAYVLGEIVKREAVSDLVLG